MDGYGRERYFHGVNVVVKGPPWIPRQDVFDPYWSFVEEDMQLLQDWGLNAIRSVTINRLSVAKCMNDSLQLSTNAAAISVLNLLYYLHLNVYLKM